LPCGLALSCPRSVKDPIAMVDDYRPLVGVEHGCILIANRLFGPTKECCRNLDEMLEGWIVVRLQRGLVLPPTAC